MTSLQNALANIRGLESKSNPPQKNKKSSKSNDPTRGTFEASFGNGLDLSEFGMGAKNDSSVKTTVSASKEYLKWKAEQKEIKSRDEREEKLMNTQVKMILANESLDRIGLSSYNPWDKPTSTTQKKNDLRQEFNTGRGTNAADFCATLSSMHENDNYGAKKENIKQFRSSSSSIKTAQSKRDGKKFQKNGVNKQVVKKVKKTKHKKKS